MANTKNYGLTGVGTEIELGVEGSKIVLNGTAIEARTNDGTALVELKAATPTTDDAVVTKRYLERTANVTITGQIDGGSPPAAVNGAIYVCTTTGGAYTEKNLYRGENSAWVEIVPFAGMRIATTTNLTGGVIEFIGDHIYLWDADTTNWLDVGPYIAPTKFVKSERFDLVFNSAVTSNLGASVPTNARPFRVIINVTQAFNGSPRSRVTVGDSISTNRLALQGESNLNNVNTFVIDCYHNYASVTQLLATYTANGATQGQAQIEVMYSTQ